MFVKYNEFKHSLNENVQQAKTYLKNRALRIKKETNPGTPEKPTGLTAQEVKAAETNPDFLKIKKMLEPNPGWTYMFTKFYFDNNVPLEDLSDLYKDLLDYRQLLNQLPMELLKYPNLKPTDEDQRGPYEILCDDLEKLKGSKLSKKFVDELLPYQKAQYEKAGAIHKEKIDGIAKAFAEFGKDPAGNVDRKVNSDLQKIFFSKLKGDKTLVDVINRAEKHIKAANNTGMSKFLQAIQNANEKLGINNGAEIIFNDNNILIIEVKSFQSNQLLNAATSHCIARSDYHWNSYVGDEKLFNKQYYIYNFNLPPNDNNSVIGITIEPKYKIRACHNKNDSDFSSQIKSYMSKIGVPFEILAPMTDEEIEKRKKRIIANKEIIKDNQSISRIKELFEDGGDPNAQSGKPLQNSVKENDIEKTKYLLEIGASPNIGQCIKYAKDLKMIKLLVDYGSSITNEIYSSVSTDYEAVEYLLKAGIDPNFENGLPLRTAAKNGDKKMLDLLIKNGADISARRYMVVKWAVEHDKPDIIDYLLNTLISKKDPIMTDPAARKKFIEDSKFWAHSSDKVTDDVKTKTKNHLDKYLQ